MQTRLKNSHKNRVSVDQSTRIKSSPSKSISMATNRRRRCVHRRRRGSALRSTVRARRARRWRHSVDTATAIQNGVARAKLKTTFKQTLKSEDRQCRLATRSGRHVNFGAVRVQGIVDRHRRPLSGSNVSLSRRSRLHGY